MKKLLSIVVLLTACWISPAENRAESWIFRPSYYSHDPETNVRIGRQYTNSPAFTRPSGAYISGGYRWVNNRITIGGTNYDNYNYWESWYQGGQQF